MDFDDDTDSDDSNMPDLVTLSSSESEYFYSDDERDYLGRFFDDDDADGIGLLVNDVNSADSDDSTSDDYDVVIEGSDSDEESMIATHCKMVVDCLFITRQWEKPRFLFFCLRLAGSARSFFLLHTKYSITEPLPYESDPLPPQSDSISAPGHSPPHQSDSDLPL